MVIQYNEFQCWIRSSLRALASRKPGYSNIFLDKVKITRPVWLIVMTATKHALCWLKSRSWVTFAGSYSILIFIEIKQLFVLPNAMTALKRTRSRRRNIFGLWATHRCQQIFGMNCACVDHPILNIQALKTFFLASLLMINCISSLNLGILKSVNYTLRKNNRFMREISSCFSNAIGVCPRCRTANKHAH